jgi:hypothetical protein
LTAVAAGLAGCAASTTPPGPAYEREMKDGRPGLFGDLTWDIGKDGKAQAAQPGPVSAAEQEEFKKWRESSGQADRQEFEEWRAWQEWKRKNPK